MQKREDKKYRLGDRLLRKFGKNTVGATAIEFAIIGPIFLGLVFTTIEFGLMLHSRAMVEVVSQQVARDALVGGSLSGSSTRDDNIEAIIKQRIGKMGVSVGNVTVTTKVYDSIINLGSNPLENASKYGGRNQIVRYTVNAEYRFLTPAAQWISSNTGSQKITSTLFVKNEAF